MQYVLLYRSSGCQTKVMGEGCTEELRSGGSALKEGQNSAKQRGRKISIERGYRIWDLSLENILYQYFRKHHIIP